MKNDKVRSHKRITTEMTKYIGQKAMFCSPEILNKLAHMRKALGTIRISEAFYHIVLKIYKSMLGKILKRFVDPILRNLRSIHACVHYQRNNKQDHTTTDKCSCGLHRCGDGPRASR